MSEESSRSRLHPTIWVAAGAVTLFSLTGVAALTGLLPSAAAHRAPETLSQTDASRPVGQALAPLGAAPTPRLHAPHTPPRLLAQEGSAARPHVCRDCGVVEGVRQVTQRGEGTGVGAVSGAVIGGVLGNQVGKGSGRTAARIGAAILGGFAGNEVEKRVRAETRYVVSVRMADGSLRSITQTHAPTWNPGEAVRVDDGQIYARDGSAPL